MSLSTSMKAAVLENYGASFQVTDVARPVPRSGQVLVRIMASGVNSLGWGVHVLAPLSFRAGSYSGVFTLLPLLTGEGKAHHGEILREATRLAEAGMIKPTLDAHGFGLSDVAAAHALIDGRQARGKLVVSIPH